VVIVNPNAVFLPGDDDETTSEASRTFAIDALLDVFRACVTRSSSTEFWRFIDAHGRDVERALDTYLQFKTRAHEGIQKENTFDGERPRARSTSSVAKSMEELWRNAFVTLARVVNDGEYERIDRSLATSDMRERLIEKYNLLDVPKLIDVCALYGRENRELVGELLMRAVALKPKLEEDFVRSGTLTGENLTDMTASVVGAIENDDLPGSASREALMYFHDVAVSFALLVWVYAPARRWVTSDGKLVEALALVRNVALPALECASDDAESVSVVRDSLNAAISSLQGAVANVASVVDDTYFGISKEVVSVIRSVRAVLPDLGIGFVKACIDHFGPNAELIVQHLFEDSLPLNLSTLDRNLNWPLEAMQTVRKSSASSGGGEKPSVPSGGYFLARKVNRDIDLEKSADDQRVLTALLNLEYEDEYDDSFDDLPVQLADTAVGGDEIDIAAPKPAPGLPSNAPKRTFYLSGGKVYHSPKEGAEKIIATSAEEAHAIADLRAKMAASEIEGLGAGGNKARFSTAAFVPSARAAPFIPSESTGKEVSEPRDGAVRGQDGRGRGTGGRATRGVTSRDFAHKNHNQKARAARKAGS